MIHLTYTHKGVNAFLLRLSIAKRRCVLYRRTANAWAVVSYDAPSASIERSCLAIAAEAERDERDALAEIETIERALGVRK